MRPKLCLVFDCVRSDLSILVTGEAEVTYVFERVGVGFGVILEEVACHCLILDLLANTGHFIFAWV